jgi:hypothetical protein
LSCVAANSFSLRVLLSLQPSHSCISMEFEFNSI